MNPIVLIGFMGAGKTTVGKKLASKLGKSMIDMDDQLVIRLGCPIDSYFATFGESAFRLHEATLLKEVLQKDAIIATGGGAILSKENQLLLKDHCTIYLKAEADILIERIRQDQKNIRPLALKNNDLELKKMIVERGNLYEQLATITIDASQKTPEKIITEIIKRVEYDENRLSRS
ncbi:shikimate kinase [Enterococcus villorum]|uniref:Shikimate kinase n=1 Tax=Enterococcus villorum TaxID=112904 RepID=A0A1V8YTU8_9ENTE|nr:shikimate kinase [Enterococcus villorum]OQO70472.1 shikimate kinase [Enterococcus villorum]OQO76052.1 shikimate kinase [Enterococcus villorum]